MTYPNRLTSTFPRNPFLLALVLATLFGCNGELEGPEPSDSGVGGAVSPGVGGGMVYPGVGGVYAYPGVGGAYAYPGVGGAYAYPGVGGAYAYPGVGGAYVYPSVGGAVSSTAYGTYVNRGTSIAGAPSADYRCNTPFNAGSHCNNYDNAPMSPGVAYFEGAGMGECVPTYYFPCNSTQYASFQTVAGCEALCGQKPSSPTCTLPVPSSGTPCYLPAERCTYDMSTDCLCSTFDCNYLLCAAHPTLEGLPSSSCSDGLCVAESAIIIPSTPYRRVCSCSNTLWQCEDFY